MTTIALTVMGMVNGTRPCHIAEAALQGRVCLQKRSGKIYLPTWDLEDKSKVEAVICGSGVLSAGSTAMEMGVFLPPQSHIWPSALGLSRSSCGRESSWTPCFRVQLLPSQSWLLNLWFTGTMLPSWTPLCSTVASCISNIPIRKT